MKIKFRNLVVIIILIFTLLIFNQCNKKDNKNYFLWEKIKEFVYLVEKSNSFHYDTLKLIILKSEKNKKINKWILSFYDNKSNSYQKDTLINENKFDYAINDKIFFQLPTINYFKFSDFLPNIEVTLPIINNYKYSGQSQITTINFDNGIDTIRRIENFEIKILGKAFFVSPVFQDSCWIIEAKGKTNYSYIAYFNKYYGFPYIKYKLREDSIQLKLINIDYH